MFHTEDGDSKPFRHEITEIFAYKGKTMEQFVIFFRDVKDNLIDLITQDRMHYFVKIKAFEGKMKDDKIEFDVFFGRIPTDDDNGKEYTINWQA